MTPQLLSKQIIDSRSLTKYGKFLLDFVLQDPGILLSLHSQCWDYRYTRDHSDFFLWVQGDQNLGSYVCIISTLPTEPSPQS